MGTNYYLSTSPCPTCGLSKYDNLHIGKSSMSWTFSLHIYPELGISSLRDWMKLLSADKTTIRDEYDNYISFAEMVQIICNRRRDEPLTDATARLTGYMDLEHLLRVNQAILDPDFGLLRAKIGSNCIRHGTGPYDYHVGDFS